MSTRSLVLLSFAATMFTLAPAAHADVPSSSSSGTANPDCTVDSQQDTGVQCQTCNPASTCGSLGSDYHYACTQSSSVEVYCNGPNPDVPSDFNAAGCAVRSPAHDGTLTGAAACGVVAIAAAFFLRRRRAS